MAHPGQERRPAGRYFTRRHDFMSQGDIYTDVPIWIPPNDALEPWDLTAGSVMVLTQSCHIDKQPEPDRLILVAPVVPVAARTWTPADLAMLEQDDCVHAYMYLPPQNGWEPRVVEFWRAQPIRYTLLQACDRLSQLTSAANRQLMRKLVIYFTSSHHEAGKFQLRPDDFPSGFDS